MSKLFLIFSFLTLSPAWAEGISHGGGDSLICQERPKNRRKIWHRSDSTRIEKTYLADTYKILKGQDSHLYVQISGADEKVLYKVLIQQLNALQANEGNRIDQVVRSLKFDYVNHNLPELEDDNIQVPPGCFKKQLAIQSTGSRPIVQVNKALHSKLSNLEKTLLQIHEAYIRIYNAPSDTTALRELVKHVVKNRKALLASTHREMAKQLPLWDFYQYTFARAHINTFSSYYLRRVSTANGWMYRDPEDLKPEDTQDETIASLMKKMERDTLGVAWIQNTLHPGRQTKNWSGNNWLDDLRSFEYVLREYYKESGRCENNHWPKENLRNLISSDPTEPVFNLANQLGYFFCDQKTLPPYKKKAPLSM